MPYIPISTGTILIEPPFIDVSKCDKIRQAGLIESQSRYLKRDISSKYYTNIQIDGSN